jgi:hypothetical protein
MRSLSLIAPGFLSLYAQMEVLCTELLSFHESISQDDRLRPVAEKLMKEIVELRWALIHIGITGIRIEKLSVEAEGLRAEIAAAPKAAGGE